MTDGDPKAFKATAEGGAGRMAVLGDIGVSQFDEGCSDGEEELRCECSAAVLTGVTVELRHFLHPKMAANTSGGGTMRQKSARSIPLVYGGACVVKSVDKERSSTCEMISA